MEWHEGVDRLKPHIVQITTPQGSGTGFFLVRAQSNHICAVATAAHVVDHAHYWEQPIRIRAHATGEVSLLRHGDRALILDEARDTAVIIFHDTELTLPDEPICMISEHMMLKVGVTVGWLGFPAIPAAGLCFFTGSVSSWLSDHDAYFVDGVAINGVSGGPAFSCTGDFPEVIGIVSAYMPNRATGETLPGLAIVRDVSQFHDVVKRFRSVEEAKAKEKTPAEPPPPPPSPIPGSPSATGRSTP
jgi:hypothetical protein